MFCSSRDLDLCRLGRQAVAQTAISADGGIESTAVGFIFPDGTVQATAAVAGSAPVEDTGQQTCYDPTGSTTDTVPCAGTGQDGELQRGVTWPTPRFTDNLNGTVTDNLTGLIWLQDANCASFFAPIDFENALGEANGLSQGFCGLTDGSSAGDWRLPNIKELLSLVDYAQSGLALPSGHPFVSVQPSFYWSSSSFVSDPATAWGVDMFDGNGLSGGKAGVKRAGEARRSAIAKIVAASPGGWTVADVRRQLESDYGIVVSLGPLYRDLKALNITPPTGAKPAAGYQRMTFDLPEALYEQLKIAAVLERRPMRELFEEATREWLEMRGK